MKRNGIGLEEERKLVNIILNKVYQFSNVTSIYRAYNR